MVETNTDAANIGGLPDVFERYRVRAFIEPGMSATTKAAEALSDEAAASHAKDIVAQRGMRIILGHGAYADILFPALCVWYTATRHFFSRATRHKKCRRTSFRSARR